MSTLRLLNFNELTDENGNLYYSMDFISAEDPPEYISGYFKLIQEFLLTWLGTTFTDYYNLKRGGGLYATLGSGYNVNPGSIVKIKQDLSLKIDDVVNQIKEAQISMDITDNEKLKEKLNSAHLIDVRESESRGDSIDVDFSVTSEYNAMGNIDLDATSESFRVTI